MNKLAALALLLTVPVLSACGGGSAQTPLQHCESAIKMAIDNGAKLTTGSAPGVKAACSGLSAAGKTKADAYAEVYAASHAPAAVASTPASAVSLPATASASASASLPSPSVGVAGTCASQVKTWYLASGSSEIADFHAAWAHIVVPVSTASNGQTLAARNAEGQALELAATPGQQPPLPTCDDPGHAWETAMAYFVKAGKLVIGLGGTLVPAAVQNAKAGFAALATVAGEIDKYTPAQP